MKSVYISPSTQDKNVGVGTYGTEEKEMNLIADVVVKELTRHGVTVYRNSPDMTVTSAVSDSNSKNPSLHVAIHSNAANGQARGCEVYCYQLEGAGSTLAKNLYKYVAALTPTADKGVKPGKDFYGPGKHMYEVAYTKAPAALIEVAFHDNAQDAAWIMANRGIIAVSIVKGILDTLGITYQPVAATQPQGTTGTIILNHATATAAQAKEWARAAGASSQFIKNIEAYFSLAPLCGGVNPIGAISQSAKETNKGNYGGIVKAEQHNPAGLKITAPNGETAADHATFNNWDVGIAAHLDHLALYAGATGYPKASSPDPRHFASIKGTATTWEALGGKYAPSGTYGQEIVSIMKAIAATPEPQQKTDKEITVDNAVADGALTDLAHWNNVLAGKIPANPAYLKIAFDNYHNQIVKAKGGK